MYIFIFLLCDIMTVARTFRPFSSKKLSGSFMVYGQTINLTFSQINDSFHQECLVVQIERNGVPLLLRSDLKQSFVPLDASKCLLFILATILLNS